MIVITTPTGDIGRQILDRVLDSGEPVRVIARDSSRLPEHVHARAEVVQGSHADADTIARALEDADRLFWLVPPAGFRDAGPALSHYLDFTRAAAQEAADRGVRMVYVTSLGHGYKGEAGLLSAALGMDELIESTGVQYRALALPFFMENVLRQAESITHQGVFSMANTADRPLLTVATQDVATAATALLLDGTWNGQARMPLASPDNLTPDGMAEIISETLGCPVRYEQVPLADCQVRMVRHGMSPALARDMADMVNAQNNGIYDAEPHGPACATDFRRWCQNVLKPAVRS
ncbi:NAD(P)H-binding protein [Streptomyces sp. NRRL B-24085]|uniref:NAD(P)H-binding protein n=1 Tax=Streptomyces sp. NRRL B-24085 TaxID=1709476 RepID=UPI0006B31D1E|nr:NAD(P)H-binding protein [Streptomyces sp. NRRL B-24085]